MGHIRDLWYAADGSKRARCDTGLRYKVVWAEPGGAERSKCFPDKRLTDARNYLKNIEADLLRGEYHDPRAGRVTLRTFTEETWLPAQQVSETSRETMEARLRLHVYPQLGRKPVGSITPTVVKGWLASLPGSPSTRRALLALLSSIMGAAVEDHLVGHNPVRSVKAPKVTRRLVVPWPAETVAAIRAGLPERYAAMADCGARLGLRQGEVLGLAVADVDFLRRRVHIRRQVLRVRGRLCFGVPKGRKERTVPLPASVAEALAEHIRVFPPAPVTLPWQEPGGKAVTAALVFTTRRGSAIERNGWNEIAWHPALKAAGLVPGRDAGFHQLRHYYASSLLAAGVDIKTVSEALGHHSAGFTLSVYTHLMPDSADRIRQAIDLGTASSHGTTTAREAGNP